VKQHLLWLALACVTTACSSSDNGPVPPPQVNLVRMDISPTGVVVAVGKSTRANSYAIDDQMRSYDVSSTAKWASQDPATATAASGGLVTGVASGTTMITATRDGLTGMAMVQVIKSAVASLAVSPKGPLTVAKGATMQLTATATLTDSTTSDLTQTATWASNNKAAVTVAAGLLTAVSPGQATVNATANAMPSNNVMVTVTQ
jgi:uncharacterized protein YjdB